MGGPASAFARPAHPGIPLSMPMSSCGPEGIAGDGAGTAGLSGVLLAERVPWRPRAGWSAAVTLHLTLGVRQPTTERLTRPQMARKSHLVAWYRWSLCNQPASDRARE